MSEPSDTDAPDTEDGEFGDDEPAESTPPRARPRKKRKKKRQKRKPESASADSESTDRDEDGHAPPPAEEEGPDATAPLPGEGTADGDKLRQAHRAFEVGDYATVRALTRALEDSAGPAVASAARALRKRVEIDPIQVVVLSCCAAVVGAILYVWIL